MLFEGFLHPALVWGTCLAAVPLLIHLFNRQRHKPLAWAAMQFVLAAYRKTRRRAQLENLLLLLLRMAAVLFLALAVARPFLSKESPLASLTESRRDLVLVLDLSASTGYRENVKSVHEAMLERARALLSSLDGARGDRARLIAAAARPRLLPSRDPAEALSLLATLGPPADEGLDLASALAEVESLALEDAKGTGTSALEVRLLTDLQKRSFAATSPPPLPTETPTGAPEPNATEPLGDVLDRLDRLGISVLVEDLGPSDLVPPNLTIEELAPTAELFGAGVPAEISVRVKNNGAQGRGLVRVALDVDGVRLPSQTVDLNARSAVEVQFPVLFKEAGSRVVTASLEGDRLAVDDARSTIVEVPAPLHVLLVNGDPHPEVEKDEVGYLRTILEPLDDGSLPGSEKNYVPFTTSIATVSAFGQEMDLTDFDEIVLANVPSLQKSTVDRLEERVAAGAALIFTLGDHLSDASAMEAANARLWRADGSGLLPARLVRKIEVPSRRTAYFRCVAFQEDHPALRFFADERWKPYFTEIPIYAFVASEPNDGSRVLATLDDPDEYPLLLEREYGNGRVVLWTTSIDRGWNRFPESPSTFVPLLHELLRYAGRGRVPNHNVAIGESPVLEVEAFPRHPFLVRPDGSRTPLDGEPLQISESLFRLPPLPSFDRFGVWRVEWDEGSTAFAACIDPEEGDLERISAADLEARHTVFALPRSTSDDEDERGDPERGELWRWFAALSLAALIGETLWSAWIARGRRAA